MSATKFTPGPWGIENHFGEPEIVSCNERDADEKEDGVIYVIAKGIGGMVHGERFDDFSEVEANSSLISAAPELYGEMNRLVDNAEQSSFEKWLARITPYGDAESVHSQWRESSEYEVFWSLWEPAIVILAKARGES